MVEYEVSEPLEEIKLNVNRRKAKKSQIFLYDTNRRLENYVMKLRYRHNEKYQDIPHFIITKTGKVISLFDTNYSSRTFGDASVDRRMVKIALENLGWLNKRGVT